MTPIPNPTPTSDPLAPLKEASDQVTTAMGGTLLHWLLIAVGFGVAAYAIFVLVKRTPDELMGKIACGVAIVAGLALGIWQWMRQYERFTGALDNLVTGILPAFLAGWPVALVIVVLGYFLTSPRRRRYGW